MLAAHEHGTPDRRAVGATAEASSDSDTRRIGRWRPQQLQRAAAFGDVHATEAFSQPRDN